MLWQTTQDRQDIRFGKEDVIMAQKFETKIWNATRFILLQMEQIGLEQVTLPSAKGKAKILQQVEDLAQKVDQNIEKFDFNEATHLLYNFFWHDFCDQYLEKAKKEIKEGTKEEQKQVIQTLLSVLLTLLKLLHPFMPFLTEAIYQRLPLTEKKSFLMIEEWPVKTKTK